jgi:predicted Zn-dependent protease
VSLLFVLATASGVGAAFTLVSVQQEVELGQQAQAEVSKQMPVLRDATLDRYIDRVGERLAAAATGPRYPYSFGVVNYKELNAFALPGGPIYVHRGTIAAARTEAQLAGVMAHEVAHVAQRHAAQQISKGMVANGLLGLLGAVLNDGSRGEQAARIGASVVAQSMFMKFSRDDESEADRVGAQIMERAGWDPHGLAEFMQVLQNEQQRSPSSVETFFSSHPSPAGRVRNLQSLVGGKSGRRDSEEFQAIKSRLGSLPRPQAMPRTN